MDVQSLKQPIYKDIRFYIIIAFVLRLYAIYYPPIELTHNWRQTTVTMVSRNFMEIDANPFYPRIDIAGEKTGITGMEFPVLNYLIYILSLVFGYHDWFGRIIVLLITSLGIWKFHEILKRQFNPQIAFNSSIVLLFSIWFTYGRKIMPDTMAMSFMLFGIDQGLKYFEKQKVQHVLMYGFWICLGVLSKLPVVYTLFVFIPLFISKPYFNANKILFSCISLIALSLNYYWYFVWVPYLNKTFEFVHFFMGKSMLVGGQELLEHFGKTINRFYETAIKFIAFAFCIWGWFKAYKNKQTQIGFLSVVGFIAFLPIMLKGGFTFYHHSYYIIPFAPILAIVSGYGISQLPKMKAQYIVLMAISIEGLGNHLDDFVIKDYYKPVLELESAMDKISHKNELICINSGEFPTPMYFAHRKGWVAYNDQLLNPKFTDSLANKGLKHIVILHHVFGEQIPLNYPIELQTDNYTIYKVRPSQNKQ